MNWLELIWCGCFFSANLIGILWHWYFLCMFSLAKYFTLCITWQPPICERKQHDRTIECSTNLWFLFQINAKQISVPMAKCYILSCKDKHKNVHSKNVNYADREKIVLCRASITGVFDASYSTVLLNHAEFETAIYCQFSIFKSLFHVLAPHWYR